jgi:adenylate cyclase
MKIETKNLIKKVVWNPWTALVTLAIILAVRVADPSFVESVRLRYFDQLVTSQPAQDIPVSVVNIDEATLDKLGQFPFPRGDYADIIQDLYQHDAGLVVFNVLMPEKDRFKQDAILGRTMQAFPTVLPAVAGQKNKNTSHGSPVQKVGQDAEGKVVAYPGLLSNVEPQSSIAAGIGIVNTFPEIDGVVRRMPLVIMVGDELYPSLAMETLRVAAGDTRIQVKIGDVGVEALRVPKLDRINTDSLSRVWIDWSATPKEYSYTELPKSFNKGVVIVGLSAAGLANPVATAKGEVWPQYLQAATLGTMLTGKTIQRPDWADNAELLALAVLGIALLFLTRWTYVGLLSGVIAIGILYPISQYLYSNYLWLVDITAISVGVVLILLHAYGVKFVSEFLQKQQIKKQFGSYLSPDLVAKLVKDPSLLKLGGTEQDLTIQFSDVRGFTSISEHYGKDVQGLTKIMNRYMTVMTKVILENEGTLDKYIGDATMSFWNAPLDNHKHAKDSVRAALEMIDAVKEFNDEIAKEGVPPFGLGVGCNTGVVVVGNMGGEQRFDYTCLGDAVNLASRLEGQSKNYGVLIVLGPETAARLDNEFFTLELDCIAVKGKKEGVNIFTVFHNPSDTVMPDWSIAKDTHNKMLAAYRKQDWTNTIKLVKLLKGEFDGKMDHYYDLWLERIEEMKAANLAADWDGVFRATSK